MSVIYFKRFQTLMTLKRLSIKLEMKFHLLYHIMPSLISMNYTTIIFNYLPVAAMLYELFSLC